MPIKIALTCAQCNAPLPQATSPNGTYICSHCGASTAFSLTPEELALLKKSRDPELADSAATSEVTIDDIPRLERELEILRESLRQQSRDIRSTHEEINAKRAEAIRNRDTWMVVAGIAVLLGMVTLSLSALAGAVAVAIAAYSRSQYVITRCDELASYLTQATEPELQILRDLIADREQELAGLRDLRAARSNSQR